jgi:hypothetical protein
MISLEEKDEAANSAVSKDFATAVQDGRKDVVKKKVIQVSKAGTPGDVAHYHKAENAVEEWQAPCHWVKHRVSTKGGFMINEVRYDGEVVVPQCTADYLAWQESMRAQYEQGIYRSKKINKVIGNV